MATNSIQTVKLNIINRISSTDDKYMLQKVWEILSSSESNEQTKRVFTKEEKAILNGLKQAFKEIKLIEQGKLQAKPLKDFLDEL